MEIRKVAIIGAGMMGVQITNLVCGHGFDVELYDISVESIERAKKSVTGGNVRFMTNREEISRDVDLVIETVYERLSLKRKILKWLDSHVERSDVILCSNSSELLPSAIARNVKKKNRFCAYHFHSPSTGADIVDIMPHKTTDADVLSTMADFTRAIGLVPFVLQKEHKAYVFNSILNEVIASSIELAIKGVAKPSDIDRAWMVNTKMGIGPFGIIDLVGLDTVYEIMHVMLPKKPLNVFAIQYFKKYIKENRLGQKTGSGFYEYPNPEYTRDGFLV
jgi:3-hydroxybutyryl-CoA dehydrogenase